MTPVTRAERVAWTLILAAAAMVLIAGTIVFAASRDGGETLTLPDCPSGQHAAVTTQGKQGGLTVENPPPGSVSGGDGTSVRANRDGRTATVKGGNRSSAECR